MLYKKFTGLAFPKNVHTLNTRIYFCDSRTLDTTVKPLLSAPRLSAELDYLRFLRPKFGAPNLYEVQ